MPVRKIFAVAGLLTSLTLSSAGCNREVQVTTQSETVPVAGGKEQIKSKLSEIATTGIGGSAVSGLRDALTELKKTDQALADGLLKDLDRLEKLQDSNQIKALAGKMADKL